MNKKWSTQQFIENSEIIHGKRYAYSKSNYINYHTKIEIICSKHGSFWQLPHNHIKGRGCKKCNCGEVFSTEEFISKAKKIHKEKYNYLKSIYRGHRHKVEIICNIHGTFFQLANSHLRGLGCNKCGSVRVSNLLRNNTKNFIDRAIKIHDNLYDYSKSKYEQIHNKIIIICNNHGEFLQTPHNHIINKQGCPNCVKSISSGELEFLNYINIPKNNRQKWVGNFKVDALHEKTIYEFLGDYYHGNPNKYNSLKYNPTCEKTFGELYSLTFERFRKLKENGYNIKYIWESDWNKFKKQKSDKNIQDILISL